MGAIHKFTGEKSFEWKGVPVQSYSNDEGVAASKRVVIGPEDGATNFAVRYFELGPGGRTSLDQHAHDHGIIIMRGQGRLQLGDEEHEVGYGDAIYVAPNEVHQIENTSDEPLGFICVVPPK